MTSFVTNIWIFPYYLYCTTWVYHPSNSPNVFLLRCSSLLCCDLRSWSISELFSGLKLIHIIYIANKFIFQLSIFVFMLFWLSFFKSSNSLQIAHRLYHNILFSQTTISITSTMEETTVKVSIICLSVISYDL